MKTNIKTILLFIISFALIGLISFSYAYFSNDIVNNNVKDQVVETGTLSLRYVDGAEINMQNIKPGSTITKTIYVANTGTLDASYNLVWQELVNEITNDEMVIEAKCTRMNGQTESESGSCNSIATKPIKDENIRKNISIEPNIVHKYDITITFKETNEPQNYNQGKKFSGVLGVTEFKLPDPVYCTFDGELTQGAEYTNGQYTYRYMQEGGHGERGAFTWQNIDLDGWGARVNVSSGDVTSKLCTYINGKPLVSTSVMIYGQDISSIDLSTSNTSTIVNMEAMFELKDHIDLNINFGNFDTSNVTDMGGMFYNNGEATIDLSSFNTSKVTDMGQMFYGTQLTSLDLSNFDTSNVTDMSQMFYGTQLTSLDLSNFDTSNVTDMHNMFSESQATILDLGNFDTSNVTDMSWMFKGSKVVTIDLSSFDTSNVTDMSWMFYACTNLKTIYASNRFVTTNVTYSSDMFTNSTNIVGGAGTVYDANNVDKTYARIDGGTALPGYFALKSN